MWFMNKIINPLVRLILRSPLHGLMSGTLLVITCCGRKTGRKYSLPVQYTQAGKTIYIVPGMPEKKNLVAQPERGRTSTADRARPGHHRKGGRAQAGF
jgi:hypothetical protein